MEQLIRHLLFLLIRTITAFSISRKSTRIAKAIRSEDPEERAAGYSALISSIMVFLVVAAVALFLQFWPFFLGVGVFWLFIKVLRWLI